MNTLIKPPCTNSNSIPLTNEQLNEIARTERCATFECATLSQFTATIQNSLISNKINILKQERLDNKMLLQLDALINYEHTFIVIEPIKDYAIWTDINGVSLGIIKSTDVDNSIEQIINTNSMYKKDDDSSMYEAVHNLLENCNDFLDSWTAEASLWPDAFGIQEIIDMVANLLSVNSDIIEQQVALNIETYIQINGQDELLFCDNNRLDISIDDIEEVDNAIAEQNSKNTETEETYMSYGTSDEKRFECAIELLEKAFNLDLKSTVEVDNTYPHEATAIIRNNNLESHIRSSNFENLLCITSFGKTDEDRELLDVVYVDDWVNNDSKLAEVIARTLKFDKLFNVSFDNIYVKHNNAVKTGTTFDLEMAYISRLLGN